MSPIFKRAAISFRAPATSSAWARLSSWHGPAMIEIGKSLPNLTSPAVTTGAAEMLAFKALILFRARPCRAPARGSTLFSGLEYQGCAMGDTRRHYEPPDMAPRGNAILPMRCFGLCHVRNLKAQRVERHPLAVHIRRNAELIAKRDLLHDLDIAVPGARLDADRARMQVLYATEGFQEDVMVGRIVGDHRHAGHGLRTIGVDLKCRVPKIFREMVLAHRKAQIRRGRIAGKNQRERELHRRSVRLCAFAVEIEHVITANAGRLERARVVGRVAAVQDQHRESLARSEKVAVEGAEGKRAGAVRHDLLRLGDFEDFDVAILQLHNSVVGAPRMAVARADGKAGVAIEFRRRVEIADGVHDMVETVRHREPTSTLRNADYFTDENAVGTSN